MSNRRHEAFAALVAGGMDHAAAWAKTLPFGRSHSGSQGALKVSAHRVFHRDEVRARIAFMRLEALKSATADTQPLSAPALGALMHQATDALRAAHDAAERDGASPQHMTKIRKALTVHAGRVRRLDAPTEGPAPDAEGFDIKEALGRLRWCSCND